MRLYDTILRKGFSYSDDAEPAIGANTEQVKSSMLSAVVVRADNTFAHLAEIGDKERSAIKIAGLPIAPPWENTFIEWHHNLPDWFPWRHLADEQAGWLFSSFDVKNHDAPVTRGDDDTDVRPTVGWLVSGMLFIYGSRSEDGLPHGPGAMIKMELGHDGSLLDGQLHAQFFPGMWGERLGNALKTQDVANVTIRQLLLPAFFTFSLMHCKNTTIREHPGRYETRQQRRLAERRGEQPPSRFYTIEIDPWKSTNAEHHATHPTRRERALHICRGHFATYTEERKLFGKYSGTFWVPAHVRGIERAGKVFKDYQVNVQSHT